MGKMSSGLINENTLILFECNDDSFVFSTSISLLSYSAFASNGMGGDSSARFLTQHCCDNFASIVADWLFAKTRVLPISYLEK